MAEYDITPPVVSGVSIAANGQSASITFTDITGPLTGGSGLALVIGSNGNYNVTMGTWAWNSDYVATMGGFNRTIWQGENATLKSTAALNIADASGNLMQAFSGQAVTNNSTTLPPTPVGLWISKDAVQGNDVTLTWAIAPQSSGYKVYRNGILQTSVGSGVLAYVQTDVPDGNYAYTVKNVSHSDILSNASSGVNALIDTGQTSISDLAATPTGDTMALTWTNPVDAVSTQIYRNGVNIGATGSGVATYSDTPLPQGRYVYYVTSTDNFANVSVYSNYAIKNIAGPIFTDSLVRPIVFNRPVGPDYTTDPLNVLASGDYPIRINDDIIDSD